MTTVDFWVTRTDAAGPRVGFSNGLSGPATAAFFRLRDSIDAGDIEGYMDEASASARDIPGKTMREILRGLGKPSRSIGVMREGHTDEKSLQAAIVDDGSYSAQAVEV